MKKWQVQGRKFLVAVLLSANIVGLMPTKAVLATEKTSVTTSETSQGSRSEGVTSSTEEPLNSEVTSAPKLTSQERLSSKASTVPVQLLGVNDFHGAIDTTGTAYLENGVIKDTGRAANLAAHLDEAEGNFKVAHGTGGTERIQAGDLVGGSPANSALLQDEPTMRIFNEMKFGIGTLGNHEFDEGLGEFRRILDGIAPVKGQFNPIVDNYPREKSTMEIVIANVVNKSDGQIPANFNPYAIRSYGVGDSQVKVGYIGIITTEFTNLVLKQHHQDYNVLDEAATIVKYAKELRDQNVNAIVVVSHLAATSTNQVPAGEAVDVMTKVNTLDPNNSVDVVFAAHNHQQTNGVMKSGLDTANDIRVVQSTSNGKAYVDVQGEIDIATGDFVETPKAEVKAVTDRPDKNQKIKQLVDEANTIIKPVTTAKVGSADEGAKKVGKISRDNTADSESPLGNLITDGQLFMANQAGLKDSEGRPVKADFALTNNGGIRADLVVNDAGDITWGAAQEVQPFGNILQIVRLSGKDLKGALNEQHANGKTHYFLQIAGLKMTYTKKDELFAVENLTDKDGTSIQDDQFYNVIINDFLFGGGDGFASFTKGTLVAAMDTDTDTFVDYFKLMEKNGQKISIPPTGRKMLHQEPSVTEAELKAASSLKEMRAGDKVITGTSLVGATVTYGQATVKADANGVFTLALEKALVGNQTISVEFALETVTISVVATVKAGTNPEPTLELEKRLKAASTVKKITEGDKVIRGTSLVGATVTYGQATVKADAKGDFSLPLEKALEKAQKVSIEFVLDGAKVTVLKTVTEKLNKTTHKGQTVIPKNKKTLPKMGAAESMVTSFGMFLLFGGFLIKLKKRQENDLDRFS